MKKIYKLLLTLLIISNLFLNNNFVCATYEQLKTVGPKISSKAGIVMEQSTGRILWEKNCKEKLKIASTTKILTAIVAVENANLEDKLKISKKAALTGG